MSGEPGGSGPAGGGTGPGSGATATGAGRLRSWLTAPLGIRLVGAVCAVAGVALLVIGLITLRGKPGDSGGRQPGAIATTASSPATATTRTRTRTPTPTPPAAPTSRPSATPSGTTPAPTVAPTSGPTSGSPSESPSRPTPVPRVPLTVLNNTVRTGLAQSAARRFAAAGWQVALIGNFAGRIPTTTVYYTPGDATQQRAAEALAAQFPDIRRVLPRYLGLPPTPPGLVVVLTRDWTP